MKNNTLLILFGLSRGVHVTSEIGEYREFEYIVIGGGSSGCVVARELSDRGFDTLLIERGDLPSNYFGSSTLYGLRDAVTDPKLSQPVVTANGVRTAVANVLGGGSSVNLGIWIEENQEYYDALMEYLSTTARRATLLRWKDLLSGRAVATQWIKEVLKNHDFDTQERSGAAATNFSHPDISGKQRDYAAVMEKVVGDWFGEYVGLKPQIQPGNSWTPHSLFTAPEEDSSRKRYSMAQAVLDANNHLTVLVNATVDQIMPKRPHVNIYKQAVLKNQDRHVVDCVHYHATGANEPTILGTIDPDLAVSVAEMDLLQRSANNILNQQNTWRLRNPNASTGRSRKVCLKGTAAALQKDVFGLHEMAGEASQSKYDGGEIILSAGTIMSPWLLFKSGIGPSHYTTALGVWNFMDNQWIGQNLQDRPVVGVSIELRGESGDLRDTETMISRHAALAIKNSEEDSNNTHEFLSNVFRKERLSSLYYSNYFSPASLFHRKTMPFEDLFGGDATEGIVWHSRMLFPPALRNLPLVDFLSDINVACGSERRSHSSHHSGAEPASRAALTHYCAFVNVMDSCSANAAVWFTFLTHVKSRGQVRVNRQGQLVVDPAYLADEADKKDIVENVRTLFQMLLQYSGIFGQVFQPITESQCPAHSFLTERDMVTSVQTVVEYYLSDKKRIVSRNEHLPFATEPQKVPNIDDDASIWDYVQNHVMSMWHLVGSNSLGVVLNDEFQIDRVDRLSVIDASALPIQTRMNPASTIMIMAKMAIDHKLRVRNGDLPLEQF